MGTIVEKNNSNGLLSKIFGDIEFNRYVLMAHTLVIQSCAGSVAVYYIMHLKGTSGTILLCLMTAITMGANAIAIAQGPMKLVLKMCLLTILFALLSILYILLTV